MKAKGSDGPQLNLVINLTNLIYFNYDDCKHTSNVDALRASYFSPAIDSPFLRNLGMTFLKLGIAKLNR